MDNVKNSLRNQNLNNSSDTLFFLTSWSPMLEVAIIIILVFICVIGNSMLCFIICYNQHLRTPANLFCINLSLADFLIGGLILPFWAVATSWQAWHLPKPICFMTAFMSIALMTSSTLTLAAISVDRYLCICRPLHYPILVTHKKVLTLIFFIWLFGLLLASSPFWGWGMYKFRPQKIPLCSPVFTDHVAYSSFLWTVIIIAPVIIILCSYCLILKAVKNQIQRIGTVESQIAQPPRDLERIRDSENQNHNTGNRCRIVHLFSYRHKSIKTIFTVIGSFFICWAPYVILNMWSLSNKTQPIPYTANLVTTFLAFSNSSINPILLIFLNKDFRSCFNNLITKIRNCHHRVHQ